MTQSIYEAAGGRPAFVALAGAWHARCLADPVVSHAFSHGFHPNHTERLADYWCEALGGPSAYTDSIGEESEVVRMHSGKGEHHEMDARAQVCFAQALEDAGFSEDLRLCNTLVAYFLWVTTELSTYSESADDVPSGLRITRWSWDGPLLESR
jgi:hemoglobin